MTYFYFSEPPGFCGTHMKATAQQKRVCILFLTVKNQTITTQKKKKKIWIIKPSPYPEHEPPTPAIEDHCTIWYSSAGRCSDGHFQCLRFKDVYCKGFKKINIKH